MDCLRFPHFLSVLWNDFNVIILNITLKWCTDISLQFLWTPLEPHLCKSLNPKTIRECLWSVILVGRVRMRGSFICWTNHKVLERLLVGRPQKGLEIGWNQGGYFCISWKGLFVHVEGCHVEMKFFVYVCKIFGHFLSGGTWRPVWPWKGLEGHCQKHKGHSLHGLFVSTSLLIVFRSRFSNRW